MPAKIFAIIPKITENESVNVIVDFMLLYKTLSLREGVKIPRCMEVPSRDAIAPYTLPRISLAGGISISNPGINLSISDIELKTVPAIIPDSVQRERDNED